MFDADFNYLFLGVDDYGAEAASITLESLQAAVCEGKDLFNTIPEVRFLFCVPSSHFNS